MDAVSSHGGFSFPCNSPRPIFSPILPPLPPLRWRAARLPLPPPTRPGSLARSCSPSRVGEPSALPTALRRRARKNPPPRPAAPQTRRMPARLRTRLPVGLLRPPQFRRRQRHRSRPRTRSRAMASVVAKGRRLRQRPRIRRLQRFRRKDPTSASSRRGCSARAITRRPPPQTSPPNQPRALPPASPRKHRQRRGANRAQVSRPAVSPRDSQTPTASRLRLATRVRPGKFRRRRPSLLMLRKRRSLPSPPAPHQARRLRRQPPWSAPPMRHRWIRLRLRRQTSALPSPVSGCPCHIEACLRGPRLMFHRSP